MAGVGKTESAGTGIAASQLAERSQLRLVREVVANPKAADDDLIVTTVDPNGIAVGATFTLAVSKLRQPRRITMTINDDDSSGLSVSARIVGHRNGVRIVEDITATSTTTNDTTSTTVAYFEDITSITLTAKTADAGAVSSTSIDADNFALIGQTLAATNIWEIEYLRSGSRDGFGTGGRF
jgi:hypothetical protein